MNNTDKCSKKFQIEGEQVCSWIRQGAARRKIDLTKIEIIGVQTEVKSQHFKI